MQGSHRLALVRSFFDIAVMNTLDTVYKRNGIVQNAGDNKANIRYHKRKD